MPIATAMTLAMTASTTDRNIVSEKLASRFWPRTDSRRNETRKVPVWMAVLSRLPSVENTLPRRPMAGGDQDDQAGQPPERAVHADEDEARRRSSSAS